MELIQKIDLQILIWIYRNCSNAFMDQVMPIVTKLGDNGLMVFALIFIFVGKGVFFKDKAAIRQSVLIFISCVLGLIICNALLKPLVGRIRPYDVETSVKLLISRQSDFSFPSGHTTAAFGAAMSVFYENKKLGTVLLVVASLVAFSRLYLFVHFPTDVIGGVFVGMLCAKIAHIFYYKFLAKNKANKALN